MSILVSIYLLIPTSSLTAPKKSGDSTLSITTQTRRMSQPITSPATAMAPSDTGRNSTNMENPRIVAKLPSITSNGSNFVIQTFTSYGKSATGGLGDFTRYNDGTNIVNVTFTSYSDTGTGRKQNFTTYAGNGDYDYSDYSANTGNDTFISYGINGNADVNEFVGFGNNSNAVTSSFSNYSQDGTRANDSVARYGTEGDTPVNRFNSYEVGGISAEATFSHYRNNATEGDDSFQTYGKGSNGPNISFSSYGQTGGIQTSSTFGSYGKHAQNQTVNFKTYGLNTTFKHYAKNGVTFSSYVNGSSEISGIGTEDSTDDATVKNKVNRWVEPGKFFREKMLKAGTVMPMPDIHDKMPKRAFLPKRIVAKLPSISGNIQEMQRLFRVKDNSTMGFIKNAINECKRAPSPGETKHCVGSAEDMVDFATSVLGKKLSFGQLTIPEDHRVIY